MGKFVDGEWISDDVANPDGAFERQPTTFRDTITADGSSGFPAAAGRYHLYVSYACPWAHRTLITRALAQLEEVIDVSVVHPHMGDAGWHFDDDFPGATGDRLYGSSSLGEIYKRADDSFTGRVTVPVLWDAEKQTIVNNESRDIIRMMDGQLAVLTGTEASLFPESLEGDVEAMIDANYETINNGVYKAGFAGNQERYEEAARALFDRLDACEELLGGQRFLCGDQLTAADVCLFTTLYRFDAVYSAHFKCNLRRIVDYPNLWGYVRDVHQTPGVAATCRLDHVKHHYYTSHPALNPKRIVPVGPVLDFDAPHEREAISR